MQLNQIPRLWETAGIAKSLGLMICLSMSLTLGGATALGGLSALNSDPQAEQALSGQAENDINSETTGVSRAQTGAVTSGQLADDLGVLTGQVDDNRLYNRFLSAGLALMKRDDVMTMEELDQKLKSGPNQSSVKVPGTKVGDFLDYQSIAKASLMFGTIYDCGRCERMHANIAGGVVVSEDGLALTNFHVLDREQEDTKTLFAMTFDGKSHPIIEVLATDKVGDVALVRLGGEGPFYPAPIAKTMPLPMEPVKVLSHPSNEYFVLTEGVISRHVKPRGRRSREHWTEITAPFGAGSSGSGVFNSKGEVVGLVSRIFPIRRSANSRQPSDDEQSDSPDRSYVELILKRCVTLDAINGCFAQ